MKERFNKVEPFLDDDSTELVCVEDDEKHYPRNVGLLWTGATWITVATARRLALWLERAIPDEPLSEPLDPRRGEEPIVENE